MTLTVNGEARDVAAGMTVLGLLEELSLRPEIVAVEINGELALRAGHGTRVLSEGDVVEFVTLVGGG
ncbi:MAG: sulfur carrier protein [Bacteroidia bacterium]|jgi:sulfur carrier protein